MSKIQKKIDYRDLGYLQNKPKFIRWKVIAGSRELSFYESYDVVFDDYDLKIRRLNALVSN